MNLSEHFTLEELTRSDTASRLGIANVPNDEQRENLRLLCINVLEPVRATWNAPVDVLSGLRVAELNGVTPGSSSSSQHTTGQAADFRVRGVGVATITRWLAHSDVPFDQLILEFASPDNPSAGWTHASYGPRNRKQVLTATRDINGATVYTQGLPAWAGGQ